MEKVMKGMNMTIMKRVYYNFIVHSLINFNKGLPFGKKKAIGATGSYTRFIIGMGIRNAPKYPSWPSSSLEAKIFAR